MPESLSVLADLDFDLDDLEVSEVRDAVALPETGASISTSSCDSSSCCASSSCCTST